jgi:RimJ/RimL family protein N-acetyltransferase
MCSTTANDLLSSNLVSRKYPPSRIEYRDENIHLIFRPFEPTDALVLRKAIELSLPELRRFMIWAHLNVSPVQQVDRILKARSDYFLGVRYEVGVFDGKTEEFLMGASWLPSLRFNPAALELGYWTVSQHRGKGLATLTTKVLTAAAFEYLESDRVEVACNKENLASRRVIEKCQFKLEGELRFAMRAPTVEMLNHGYSNERNCLLYALIQQDRSNLPWYKNIFDKMAVTSLFVAEKR